MEPQEPTTDPILGRINSQHTILYVYRFDPSYY